VHIVRTACCARLDSPVPLFVLYLSSLSVQRILFSSFFFFNDPATTEIYTLSLHDALPICRAALGGSRKSFAEGACGGARKLERVELTAQRLEPVCGLEKRWTGERGDSFRRLAQGDPASPVSFKTLAVCGRLLLPPREYRIALLPECRPQRVLFVPRHEADGLPLPLQGLHLLDAGARVGLIRQS